MELRRVGPEHLQVLTDYDQTLTKERYLDGKRADSSFKALQDSRYIPNEIKVETRKLFDKYSLIELDKSISHEEKSYHM